MRSILHFCFCIVFLLLIHAVLRSNLEESSDQRTWLLTIKLLDVPSAVTLLVGLLTVFYLRHEYITSRAPVLVIKRMRVCSKQYSITLKNVGSSLVIFTKHIEFKLVKKEGEFESMRNRETFSGASDIVAKLNLQDVQLENVTERFGLAPGDETILAVLPNEILTKLEEFNAYLWYRDVFGNPEKKLEVKFIFKV